LDAETYGVIIWRPLQKRGVPSTIEAMINCRSAIEPTIGTLNTEDKLVRYWFQSALGDPFHAALCGASHILGMLSDKLQFAGQHLAPCYYLKFSTTDYLLIDFGCV
jgi:hypothetical protein